jgi:CRP/FNR family transcriptional regulator/CRP/FNR family cyclic AMP-dependent transcriptional regulator
MRDKNLLRSVPLFSELEEKEIDILLKAAEKKKYRKNKVIFFEDEFGDVFFLIISGKIKVTKISLDGHEIILSILKEGDFFGEMSLLDNEPRSATAIALDDSELIVLKQENFLTILYENKILLRKLLSVLSQRLRKADKKIADLALLKVQGRVAQLILDLAKKEGIALDDGSISISVPSKKEIAGMVGASRETVSRSVNELKRKGYINQIKRKLIINPSLLKDFS